MIPVQLKQLGKDALGIVWNDGHSSIYGVRKLRLACRCAQCVDEWTQESRIKEENISLEVRPNHIETVGRYALQFIWSDGHDTGIYPFEQLRSLCECPLCKVR